MSPPVEALVGFGASVGDPARALRLAVAALGRVDGVELLRVARPVWSAPMGPARGRFLNSAILLLTTRSPRGLLGALQAIERRLGRRPAARWHDRVVDLDLLLHGDAMADGLGLRLPHPGLLDRAFALGPAAEIGGHLWHPGARLHLRDAPAAPGPAPRPARVAPPLGRGYAARATRPSALAAGRRPPMQFFLDTANLDQIREAASWGLLDGVTTNPSLIAREGGDFIEMVHQICQIVKGPVSAETVAQDAPGMIREGRLLAKVDEHVVVKVPLTIEGLKATRALSDEGIPVNVTLCFQASQALLAAKAGATYISPFLGRLDDISTRGVGLIEEIVKIYRNYPNLKTKVLAASIRHPLHVTEVALAGADVCTLPFSVLRQLVQHPLTDSGNEKFLADWAKVPDPDIAGQVQRWLDRRG